MTIAKAIKMKGAVLDGVTVDLYKENEGETFRVNVFDGITPRTRVFTDYQEASAYFDAHVQGN